MMTGVDAAGTVARCNTLARGRARVPATANESMALQFRQRGDWTSAYELLKEWAASPERRVFRREVFSVVLQSLQTAGRDQELSLVAAVEAARERRRHRGRSVHHRAVGSTLLLKGLEADYVILLDVDNLSAAHVYVAVTRATRGLKVFSTNRWLGPGQRR
jgi:DNA helicase-2/ATP-dependent DNA helicase PcrA